MEPIKDFFRFEKEEPHLVPITLASCVLMGLLASFFAESNPHVFFGVCRFIFLLSLGALIAAGFVFLLIRWLIESRRTQLGSGEIAKRDGYAFGLWFAAHNLLWVCLISASIYLIRPIGVQGWVLVLLAGCVAGMLLSVSGIFTLKRRWVLGISWLSPAQAGRGSFWGIIGSSLLLRKRYQYAVRADACREEPVFHVLVSCLDVIKLGRGRQAVRLWQDRLTSIKQELWGRLLSVGGVFIFSALLMLLFKLVSPEFNPVPAFANISDLPGGGNSALTTTAVEKEKEKKEEEKESKQEDKIKVPEKIKLGDITRLKSQKARVGLRIYPPNKSITKLPKDTYWRLMVLDAYQDGECSPSTSVQNAALAHRNQTHTLKYGGRRPPLGVVKFPGIWRLKYEPGFSRYIPSAGPYKVARWQKVLSFHSNGDVYQRRLPAIPTEPLSYEIDGMVGCEKIAASPLDSLLKQYRKPVLSQKGSSYPFTTLDLSSLSPKDFGSLKKISANITAGIGGRDWEKFRDETINFLQKDRKYTQDYKIPRRQGGRDPVLEWIEAKQDGHCEYFSYAFMMLARAGGYPTRVICGFSGADYSEKEKCFIARLDVAHAWCEMFNGKEWVRVEPTPPAPPNSSGGSGQSDSGGQGQGKQGGGQGQGKQGGGQGQGKQGGGQGQGKQGGGQGQSKQGGGQGQGKQGGGQGQSKQGGGQGQSKQGGGQGQSKQGGGQGQSKQGGGQGQSKQGGGKNKQAAGGGKKGSSSGNSASGYSSVDLSMKQAGQSFEFKVPGLAPIGTEQPGQSPSNANTPGGQDSFEFPDSVKGQARPARQNLPSYVSEFFTPKKNK
jgi:hypothetical protein